MADGKSIYDLEERTYQFAGKVRNFVKNLPGTTANVEDGYSSFRFSGRKLY